VKIIQFIKGVIGFTEFYIINIGLNNERFADSKDVSVSELENGEFQRKAE
jgi:hypothetical protein